MKPLLCLTSAPPRRLALLACVLSCLSITSARQVGDEPAPALPAKDFRDWPTWQVRAVKAGNLLVVRQGDDERTLRLIGTTIPESGTAEVDARAFAVRLLAGESVYVEQDPNWPRLDREQRTWAYVYRVPDGLFVNLELVRQGYARVSAATQFEHEALLRAYERCARQTEKGLWTARAATDAPPTSQPVARPATRPSAPADEHAAELVYVSKSGQKYHRKDCQFVKEDAKALSVQQAKIQGYTPCARCKPPE